jgi:hypothetical protein
VIRGYLLRRLPMKQRITRKDLDKLADEQKRRLNELWTPSLYDAAVARVLKNVATDEYDEYTFVVGGISIYGTSIYLTDIAAGKTGLQSESESADTEMESGVQQTEDPSLAIKIDPLFGENYQSLGNRDDLNIAVEGIENAIVNEDEEDSGDEMEEEESFEEGDLEDNYQLPAVLIKADCTPLLTIGCMIEILQKNNFGKFDFFLSACTYDIGCELGRGNSSWGNYSGWEPAELCDVLWESVKELL